MSWKKIGYWYKSFIQSVYIGSGFTLTPKNITKGVSWKNPKVFSSSSNIVYMLYGVIKNVVRKINSESFSIEKHTTNITRQPQLQWVYIQALTGVGVNPFAQPQVIQIHRFHPIIKFLCYVNNSVAYTTTWYNFHPSHKRNPLPYKIKFYKRGQENNPLFIIHEGTIWDLREDRTYTQGKDVSTFKLIELKDVPAGTYEIDYEFKHNYNIGKPEEMKIVMCNAWQLNCHICIDNLWLGDNTYYTDNIIYAYDEK